MKAGEVFMKAFIVEIYKNYCIVMTADGQFMRQEIPAGLHEIGDEIILEEPVTSDSKKGMTVAGIISRVAIGFAAVAIVVAGTYFGIRYIGTPGSVKEVSLVQVPGKESDAAMMQESQEGIFEEKTEQAGTDASFESLKSQPQQEAIQAPLLYEAQYNIEKYNTDLIVEYPDLHIVYRINSKQQNNEKPGDELNFNFTAVRNDISFNGNVDAILNDENRVPTRTLTVVFNDFALGQQKNESLILEDIEKSFKLIIYGYFE